MNMNENHLKRCFSTLLTIVVCFLLMPANAFAAEKVIGFPLPVKSTPYNVTVLGKYHSGSVHSTYLYTYGPLKNKSADQNIVMDIAADAQTPIYCVADGTVYTNTYGDKSGNYVVIKHNDGSFSYYGHMYKKSTLKVGKTIKAGDLIGYVGSTGLSTGNHIHFEWSGHDPFCEYAYTGLVKIASNSGASKYPHQHKALIPNGVYTLSPMCSPKTCLDIAGGKTSNGTNVQIYIKNNTDAQKFRFTFDPKTNSYTITNVASNKVLDVQGGKSNSGTNVQQWQSNSTAAQKWILKSVNNGYYTLIPALNQKLALDVSNGSMSNGTNVQVWTRNNSAAQKWKIVSTNFQS